MKFKEFEKDLENKQLWNANCVLEHSLPGRSQVKIEKEER
jgi:hypothetical protein